MLHQHLTLSNSSAMTKTVSQTSGKFAILFITIEIFLATHCMSITGVGVALSTYYQIRQIVKQNIITITIFERRLSSYM